jgi:hypothetical protein
VITTVPATTPVTVPLSEVVAIELLELENTPPGTSFDSEDVLPTQIVVVPTIADGTLFIVAIAERAQPFDNVYEIVALPRDMPESTPEAFISATDGALFVHEPPDGVLLIVEVAPLQMLNTPENTDGVLLTVTTVTVVLPDTA